MLLSLVFYLVLPVGVVAWCSGNVLCEVALR